MTHLSGSDRRRLLLLPGAVDDHVGPDDPVRFVDAFVDGLDLAAAGFARVRAKGRGCPGYDPSDLPKLCIDGSLNRVRSLRSRGRGDRRVARRPRPDRRRPGLAGRPRLTVKPAA